MASSGLQNHISIECVDNADGFPGVVIYDDKTFSISSQQIDSLNVVNIALLQQGTAFGAGYGLHSVKPFLTSTVRTYQSSRHEDKETAMEWEPPETNSDSNASNGAPPLPPTDDDEVPMEVD